MKTILLLDRDSPRSASLHNVLNSAGLKVIAESDRHFLLFLLATEMPLDVVISHADIDCSAFLRDVKQIALFVRVVVLTNNRSFLKRVQALSLGAHTYISGPVKESEIVRLVRAAGETPHRERMTDAAGRAFNNLAEIGSAFLISCYLSMVGKKTVKEKRHETLLSAFIRKLYPLL